MARQTPLCLWLSLLILAPGTATTAVAGERITAPRPSGHVPELRHYLDDLVVHQPLMHAGLAVFPLTLRRSEQLPGRWLTMDEAIRRKFLVVTERKGRATVPVIYAENRSPREHVFLMAGEVVSGGKQTRTIREDVVLAPAQKVDVGAFCVEAHRWSGTVQFGASRVMLPQSIQKEMRKGASQRRMWAEVSRSNRALKSQNATDSLELSLNASSVRTKLDPVRRAIVQEVPGASVGFIFVHRGRAVGGEFFGHSHMARALLPKLLDSYCSGSRVAATGKTDTSKAAGAHSHRRRFPASHPKGGKFSKVHARVRRRH